MRRTLRAVAIALLISSGVAGVEVSLAAPASAQVDCEYRGTSHRGKHGGIADDEYHLARGERVTCDAPRSKSRGYEPADTEEHDDGYHRRDRSIKPNLLDLLT